MRDLIIYGAGGFGRETALMVSQINSVHHAWRVIGFCDDNLKKGQLVDYFPVLGGIGVLNSYMSPVSVAIAISDPHARKETRARIKNSKVDFPVLVHPSTKLGDAERNSLQEGSIVAAGNIFTTNIHVGSFVIINLSCTIGHDVVIHDFCSLMPCSSISGAVTLEQSVQVGTGARILPGLTIGENSRVGAGAVVTRNVERRSTVIGIPARPLVRQ